MSKNEQPSECVNSIYQRPWWLDAVAPGRWRMLEVVHNGAVCARMPIVERTRLGCRLLNTPPLTHTLGPWIKSTDAKMPKRIGQEKEWLSALIEQLPPFDYFCQNFHYTVQNWYPFYWKNFESSVVYTYIISDISDFDKVYANFDTTARNKVRKAGEKLAVRTDLGVDALWRMTEKSFARWKRRPPYSFEYLSRLDAACVANQARRLFCAEDAEGNIHASLYLVYDANTAYCLVSGADPDFRQSGAVSLLMSEAIRFASTVSRTFDFEGTMVEPIEEFFRSFGGTPKPLLTIRGYSRRMKMIQGVRSMMGRVAG